MTPTDTADRASRITPDNLPKPRVVAMDAPWTWLSAGWRDLWQAPQIGLIYGAVAALLASLLAVSLALVDAFPLFLTMIGGFLLIGPLMAVGLYETSRRLAKPQPVTLKSVALAPMAARGQLAFIGTFLLLMFFVWMRVAVLIFMLFVGTNAIPPASEFLQMLLFTPHGLGLLVVGTAVGAVFAAIVFATTVVSIPLLLTKRIDALTAVVASVNAVRVNPLPLGLWAVLIVVIMAAGFTTLLLGLVVAFPLIGHATWHAYADIYGDSAA